MRLNVLRSSLFAGLAGMFIATACFAEITSVPPAAYVPPALPKSAAVTRLLAVDAPRRVVALPAPSPAELGKLRNANAAPASAGKQDKSTVQQKRGRPLAIGIGRDVPIADRSISGRDLQWQPAVDGGQVARIDVSSEGAAAVRVALTMSETDPDVTLRFAGSRPGAAVFGPYPANKIAGSSSSDGMFWSPVLDGGTATIEVYLPAGVSTSVVRFNLARVSHLAVGAADLLKVDPLEGIGESDSCEIDVACVAPTAALTNAAASVARIIYTDEFAQSWACSGTLLNDSKNSMTPYLFTASHCLYSQYVATTTNTFWFFDAVACRSLTTPPYVQLIDGATMLARSDDWDWGLVRLNSAPPAGTMFSAWRADALGDALVPIGVLHHPEADLKKWSQGTTLGFRTFDDGSSLIQVRYNQGSTEGGSSGSGLLTFFTSGGYYEVRGGLFGGDATCRNVTGSDYYSRLDVALPLISEYLTPGEANPTGTVPVVEFYNAELQHYFISTDPGEINDLDTGVHTGWVRTGLRFLAYPSATTAPVDAEPVCRFYARPESQAVRDSHFISGSAVECADTLAKFGNDWIYESPSVFYIQMPDAETGACPAGTRPVWRYWNALTANHRWTVEVLVRDDMAGDSFTWNPEGYGRGPYLPTMCSPNT